MKIAIVTLTLLGYVAADMWINHVEHGISAFNDNSANYQVFRNVRDFGCVGDGNADDTACINAAISSGNRCGQGCGSSTLSPAVVYFPPGRYLVTDRIIMLYYTQLVGDATDPPTLIAGPNFDGIGLIDSDPYGDWGVSWYTNQNNFFRQIRNFVIDLTQTPSDRQTTGLHWQVAQATSLINIKFVMTPNSNHRGIFMENGSGGFLSDLTFQGGALGMWAGNQQFLSRNLVFDGCDVAIFMGWDWEWTWKEISISNARIGIDISSPTTDGDPIASGIGSIVLLDSTLDGVQTGILTATNNLPNSGDTSNTIFLDNVSVNNVVNVIADTAGNSVLNVGGSNTIAAWGRGSIYRGAGQEFGQDSLPTVPKSPSLLDGAKIYSAKRPQYENLGPDDFVSVKANGARGDGQTDDTAALQNVINANVNGKVIYFPSGTYILESTLHIPPGTRMIGEAWPALMARGALFGDENNPQPVIQVGSPGDSGVVEITEFIFNTNGGLPGAILVEWNIHESSQGSAGMWDSHFRVGGTRGTNLQVNTCASGSVNVPSCFGVHTLLHLTPSSSAYLENVWAWTADHDLDDGEGQGQVSIFTGRGVLIQSTDGPVWLYGTQSEHNVLYQYQLDGAHNIFLTMIQSESPYFQPVPPAPQPWTPNPAFNDPTYSHCAGGDNQCPFSYSIRIVGSSNIFVYGAGMYNFFSNYDQGCLDSESCQSSMADIENSSGIYMFNINTKAAVNMIVRDNTEVIATSNDNSNDFCQTINVVQL